MAEKNLNAAEVARKCHVNPSALSYIFKKNLKHSGLCYEIASGLGIDPRWLNYGEGTPYLELAYKVPLFEDLIELIRFLNEPDIQTTKHLFFTESILEKDAFAFVLSDCSYAICSTRRELKSRKYFEIISAIPAAYEINDQARSVQSFPIVFITENFLKRTNPITSKENVL